MGGVMKNKIVQWHDMTYAEYQIGRVTSVIGGSTWIRTPHGYFYVAEPTPCQILAFYDLYPDQTIRVEIVYPELF